MRIPPQNREMSRRISMSDEKKKATMKERKATLALKEQEKQQKKVEECREQRVAARREDIKSRMEQTQKNYESEMKHLKRMDDRVDSVYRKYLMAGIPDDICEKVASASTDTVLFDCVNPTYNQHPEKLVECLKNVGATSVIVDPCAVYVSCMQCTKPGVHVELTCVA